MTKQNPQQIYSFVGPDGGGKTTIIDNVAEHISAKYVFHLKLGKKREIGSKSNPNTVRQYGLFLSVVKLFYLVIESHLSALKTDYSGLVILDRNVQEIFIDQKRFGYNGPNWLLPIGLKLMLKPRRTFVILATPEQYVERKNEITISEGVALNQRYKEYASLLGAVIIDNSGSLDDAIAKVVSEIEASK